MKVVSPGFECTDDNKEFVIIDVIILICWGEGLKKI